MPLHDYRCLCSHEFEQLVKNGELPVCPECKQVDTVTQLISFPKGYQIKGDNGASTSPKAHNNAEKDRQFAKRERMNKYFDKGHF